MAIVALLLATGLREGEVVKLEIDDLYQTYGGVPALRVKSGKGAKARMVPFGDMLWARQITAFWLNRRESGSGLYADETRSRRYAQSSRRLICR